MSPPARCARWARSRAIPFGTRRAGDRTDSRAPARAVRAAPARFRGATRLERLVFLELFLEGRRLDPLGLALGPFGRVTSNLRLQHGEVDEVVRLAAELVGDHRRLGGQRRDNADL